MLMTKVVLTHANAKKAKLLATALHTSVNFFVNSLIDNVDPELLLKAVDNHIDLLKSEESIIE